MKYILPVACAVLIGCTSTESPVTVADRDSPTQAELDAMSDACNAPREWLSLEGSELRFRPITDEEIASGTFEPDYETAACVLTQIKQSGLTKFGFVGNERYVTPEEGQ